MKIPFSKALSVLAAAVFAASAHAADYTCSDETVYVVSERATLKYTIELADTPAERSVGLMNRESMPGAHGMLFIYDAPQYATFWMKNTLIPLDMLFADETGRITYIHENAIPLDTTKIFGGEDVLAVLEINGGQSARYGLSEGDVLVHPAFGDEAAISCGAQ